VAWSSGDVPAWEQMGREVESGQGGSLKNGITYVYVHYNGAFLEHSLDHSFISISKVSKIHAHAYHLLEYTNVAKFC
jgi:hypothetical protein